MDNVMNQTKTILIVDDEPAIRDMLSTALEMNGYDCLQAMDIQQAHTIVMDHKPNLILLDWMLPGGNGIDWIRRLKKNALTASIPVIMLTAKSEDTNKIQGLEMGADDYITKPFSLRELQARLSAVLRRTEAPTSADTMIEVEALCMDLENHRVTINHEPLHLGPTEYRLLEFFLRHQERAYTRGQLLDHVWGEHIYVEERTVDVHIRRLRKALPGYEKYIQTVRGTGYRFSTQ